METQTLGPATVVIKGGIYPTERGQDTFRNAKLSFVGNSPNATVKLYAWEMRQDADGHPTSMGFVEIDKLTEARVTENELDGRYDIRGISERFTNEFPHTPDLDNEAIVTWDVLVTGQCADCG